MATYLLQSTLTDELAKTLKASPSQNPGGECRDRAQGGQGGGAVGCHWAIRFRQYRGGVGLRDQRQGFAGAKLQRHRSHTDLARYAAG